MGRGSCFFAGLGDLYRVGAFLDARASAVSIPTTFGRQLRRAGSLLVPVLDELIWHQVGVG